MQRLPWTRRLQFYQALNYHPVSQTALRAHQSEAHRLLIAGGEDGGKSYWLAHEFGPNVLSPPPPGRVRLFTLAGPTYAEPRIEFDYLERLLDEIGVLEKAETPKEGQWRLHLAGTGNIVETRSLEDVGNIRAYKPDGIGICEAGKCQKMAIDRLVGRASAYDAFMVLSGTFEQSEQWYHDWYRLGQVPDNGIRLESFSLPTWENTANYPGGRNDPKIKEMEDFLYAPDYFLERCAAVPVPPSGLILKGLDPTRHIDPKLTYDPNRGPVFLWVDPGYGGAYAVEVFQFEGQRVFGIDEVYEPGLTTEEMIGLCKKRPWWSVVARKGVIDFAGKQHQASESVIEQWWRLERIKLEPPCPKGMDRPRPVKVYEAIERIQTSLHRDQIVLSPRMRGALKEANIGEGPVPGMTPWKFKTGLEGTVIDRNSTMGFNHAWMAIAYGLLDHFGFVERTTGGLGPVRYLDMGPSPELMSPERRLGPVKVA